MNRYLVTGGCGFLGSAFVHHVLRRPGGDTVVNLDALTYAADPTRLGALDAARYRFTEGDISDQDLVEELAAGADIIVHFAAETHVDRSIESPAPFVRTNITGTFVLLEAARRHKLRFHHISTDEVYGPLPPPTRADELAPARPTSPYAASKASADHLVMAWHKTWGVCTTISRATNCFGAGQNPEKLIPRMIQRALAGEDLPLYGDGKQRRWWLHAEDHARAVWTILQRGTAGEIYNVSGDDEFTNRAVVEQILAKVAQRSGQDPGGMMAKITRVRDRLGHDRRYGVDDRKLRALGWSPSTPFGMGLARTIDTQLADRERKGRVG